MLKLNKIYCIDVIEGLKQIEDNTVDIIIIDPPYNIGKNFVYNNDKLELQEYIKWSKMWIEESIRVMKTSATMFIYGFSETLAHLSVEIPLEKRWLIWHYTNKNVPLLNFWQRSHESIIVCWKDKYIFNKDEVREPYSESFIRNAAGKVRKGTNGRYSRGGKETIYSAHAKGALPRDVVKVPALAGGAGASERWFMCKTCKKQVYPPFELKNHDTHEIIKHPTQKPLALSEKLIKSCKPVKDGIVLVPFVGSGTECVAGKKLGLNYIGFEINPDYIKLAEARLKEI